MVVVLIIVVIGGGLYLISMGGMDHGNPGTNVGTVNDSSGTKVGAGPAVPGSAALGPATPGPASGPDSTKNGTQQSPGDGTAAGAPPVIVIPPPAFQGTPANLELYVDQLKTQLKAINETNSSIALNSGGTVKPDGTGGTSGLQNQNGLYYSFYKLGQDVSAMNQTLDQLSKGIQTQNGQPNPIYYYSPGVNQPVPGQNQPVPIMPNPNNSQTGHPVPDGSGMFNFDSLKVVLTLVLLGSIVFAGISLVGFVSSLFKDNSHTQQISRGS